MAAKEKISINPFSDPMLYIGKRRMALVSKIAKILLEHNVHVYGPIGIGKKTMVMYLLTHVKFNPKHNISVGIRKKKGWINIEIPFWGPHNIEEYIKEAGKAANREKMRATHRFVEAVYSYTSGNPSVIKPVLYHAFHMLKKGKDIITLEHFGRAKHIIEMELELNWFKYVLSITSKLERKVLKTTYNHKGDAILPTPKEISKKTGIPLNTITKTLCRLREKGIIWKEKRGIYKPFSYAFIVYLTKQGKAQ